MRGCFAYCGHIRKRERERQLKEPYGTWVVDIEKTFTGAEPAAVKADITKWKFFIIPQAPRLGGPFPDKEPDFGVLRVKDGEAVYFAACEAKAAGGQVYFVTPRTYVPRQDSTMQLRLKKGEVVWLKCTIPQLAGRRVVLRRTTTRIEID